MPMKSRFFGKHARKRIESSLIVYFLTSISWSLSVSSSHKKGKQVRNLKWKLKLSIGEETGKMKNLLFFAVVGMVGVGAFGRGSSSAEKYSYGL